VHAELGAHWGLQSSVADYQVAAFARDMLSAAAAGLAPLTAAVAEHEQARLVAEIERQHHGASASRS
jgi:hypothetical protein